MGKDFDLGKYISQAPSNVASVRNKLSIRNIKAYRPTMVTAAECHVEFKVVRCF